MPTTTPYQRPPITRGLDPTRVNWLWRLVCEAAGWDARAVHHALVEAGVSANLERVTSWLEHESSQDYFPLSIAELERNLRALASHRHMQESVPEGD